MAEVRKGRKPDGRTRVMTRLLPADLALIDEISRMSGESRSKVLMGILDETMPVMRQQFAAMKLVSESPERAAQAIANLAETARANIAQAEMEFKREGRRGRRAAP